MAAKKKNQPQVTPAPEKEVEKVMKAVEDINNWKTIMSAKDVPLRSFPSMEQKHIIGTMPANKGFKIYKEVSNLYGGFYLLENGAYISKSGSYTIY